MRTIKLSRGQVAKVSDSQFPKLLIGNKWYALLVPSTGKFYAVRTSTSKGVKKMQYMHRLVMGIEDPNVLVDHKDRDSLNNQDYNLRVASPSMNVQNQGKREGSTSRFIGVSWSSEKNKWAVYIKQMFVGRFNNETESAKAYDRAAIEQFGEEARLNFPRKRSVCQGI